MIKLSRKFFVDRLLQGGCIAVLAGAGLANAAEPSCAIAPASAIALQFPKLCSIPARPDDKLGAVGYHALVVGTRQSGAALVQATAPQSFSLSNTEAFAAEARAEATPPAPLTTSSAQDTETFASEARERATPSPRPR